MDVRMTIEISFQLPILGLPNLSLANLVVMLTDLFQNQSTLFSYRSNFYEDNSQLHKTLPLGENIKHQI